MYKFQAFIFFNRKERNISTSSITREKPQRTQFPLCAFCVRLLSLRWSLSFVEVSLSEVEVSKYAPFALKILLLTLMFSCGEPLMEIEDNTLLPVVECYLQEGADNLTVNVFSMEEFLKDDVKLSRPISKLNVTINDIELTETSSGTYSLNLSEDTLREGQTYILKFNHNGKRIEATTTIPSPIHSLTVEPQSITLSSSYFWDFSDTTQVVVSWDDPDNSFYQVYIDSPNNPDMPSMGVFRRRMMQPFQSDRYRISTRELRSAGTHTIYVYRVSKEYAELYERVSASDLANPVSYIQNAFGIFTSISVAKITIRVYNES